MGKDKDGFTISDSINDLISRIRDKDPDAFREQPYKKGQYLSNFHTKAPAFLVFKVVATSKYSVLVKDMTFKSSDSIPFTFQKKNWDSFKPMTEEEVKKWKSDKFRSKLWQAGMDAGTFLSKKLNVQHTKEPQKAGDYFANLIAFVVTYSARKQMEVYSPNEPNLFKGLFAHGPIYPGQKEE